MHTNTVVLVRERPRLSLLFISFVYSCKDFAWMAETCSIIMQKLNVFTISELLCLTVSTKYTVDGTMGFLNLS